MNGADKAQLRQVRAAILRNRPDTSLSSTLYPVYVAVIAAGTYGVPASQQLFRSLDKRWLAEHVWSSAGAIVALSLAALLLTVVRLVCLQRLRVRRIPGQHGLSQRRRY